MTHIKTTQLFSILSIMFVATFLSSCKADATKISITDNEVRISGYSYGVRINVEDVKEIKLLDRMPRIVIRTNGIAVGATRIGRFNLENTGRAKLFLHSREAPFILIERNNERPVFLNYKEKGRTEKYYQKLTEWLE